MKTRKMFRKFSALTAVVLTALTLTACGGGKKAADVDVAKLADELNSSVITTDTLSEPQDTMLSSIYFFEDGQLADHKIYMSNNTTADEIVVAECADEKAAKSVSDLLKTRVGNQKNLFESYNPDEAAKLDKALVKTAGKYAVMVVCDDYDKAESILKEAGF